MISTKTWYKIHDGKLLAIVKLFKTWRHYLEDYKHKVLIPPNHSQFWAIFHTKLANKGSYQASISSMRLRIQELQETHSKAQELRQKKDYQDINGILHHQDLPCTPEAIQIEFISRHHNDFLASHFGIEKTQELVAKKYY